MKFGVVTEVGLIFQELNYLTIHYFLLSANLGRCLEQCLFGRSALRKCRRLIKLTG